MRIAKTSGNVRGSGLTLVELLVVMIIMLTLMGIGVYTVFTFQSGQQVGSGSDQLQGWLLIARQKALRDQIPRGVRLQAIDSTTGNAVDVDPTSKTGLQYATQLQYIEQAADFKGGVLRSVTAVGNSLYQVKFTGVDFTGGYGVGISTQLWPVQRNDTLEIGVKSGNQFTIQTVVDMVTLVVIAVPNGPVPSTPFATSNYRILRAPRPLASEATLQMPGTIVIDFAPRQTGPNTFDVHSKLQADMTHLPAQHYDILFAPSGAVVAPGGNGTYANLDGGQIILWVRDIGDDPNNPKADTVGEQRLIVIYTRTGFIAAHPVYPTKDSSGSYYTDPYYFVRDGQSSGL